nr:ethylene-responsive transcription factor ABR1-like [Ipomoea trifida]
MVSPLLTAGINREREMSVMVSALAHVVAGDDVITSGGAGDGILSLTTESGGRIARTRSGPPETATFIYTPTTTHHNAQTPPYSNFGSPAVVNRPGSLLEQGICSPESLSSMLPSAQPPVRFGHGGSQSSGTEYPAASWSD